MSGKIVVMKDPGAGHCSAPASMQASSVAIRPVSSSVASSGSTETTNTKKKANDRQQTRKTANSKVTSEPKTSKVGTQNRQQRRTGKEIKKLRIPM